MSKRLKAAVIGCGMIAQEAHLPAYKHFSDKYELCAVCDVSKSSVDDTARLFGIEKRYTDAQKMLEEAKPDIVSVCVPNMLHKHYTELALSHGANVICEKPLAFSLKDATELFELAKSNGLFLCACQSMRFTPDRLAAKRQIENGLIGTPYYCEFSRIRRRGIPTWGTFHIKESSGGGALIDIGVHMLDAVLWLMENPAPISVCGSTYKKLHTELGSLKSSGALTGDVRNARSFNPDEMNVEDFSCGSISFENGARINFKVAWAANLPDETTIRLIGEQSGIELPTGTIFSGESSNTLLDLEADKFSMGQPFSGHFYVLENAYDVIVNKKASIIKPEETINTSAIIEAFYKSAELCREVYIHELEK